MNARNVIYKSVSILVALTLLLSTAPPGANTSASPPHSLIPNTYPPSTGLYRTRITLRQPTDRARLEALGVSPPDL
jgi:hypothetical protein